MVTVSSRRAFTFISAVLLFLTANAKSVFALSVVEADVVVYGGTSAGVVAAVQAVRLGKTAVLVVFNNHLGGMSSGGLGQTDIGNKAAIGGIAREFYRRVGQHYGKTEAWTFEPHVAEETFNEMIEEAKVPVHFNQRLASVTMRGTNIFEITMESGTVFRGKMFVDATYEGDLMAKAGVSYAVGREANSVYGETLNGIRGSTPLNQFTVPVDPYLVPGNSASGLLPLLQAGDGGTPGAGDQRIQAYNFRMCLTQNATNKIPIEAPANYDAARFELLARYIEARVARGETLQLRQFFKLDGMPNGKTDSNNEGGFSTDYIGYNYDYPEADYARRAEIWKEHEDYIRGFFTFLRTSPRVPPYLRAEMQSWGLAKDEFKDTGGWPHQLYVREARRMISDYVMTEHNCRGEIKANDPVSLAAYNMDSHNCQRIVKNGSASNEGDVQVGVSPYPISYRSIIPKTNECANLLVPVCLSSSHIAYGSIRMEPVFMVLGQSAATAACFAIDDEVSVQQLDYTRLQLQLRADEQVLEWGGSSAADTGIIVDNADAAVAVSGDWSSSTSVSGFYGGNYLHDGNTGKGTKSIRFTPNIPTDGVYNVYLRWTTDPNRASNVPVDVIHSGGTNKFTINQRNQNGQWVLLGSFSFDAGTNGGVVIRTTGTDGYVVADAARFADAAELPVVNLFATDASASEWRTNTATVTALRDGNTNAPLVVNYAVSGTASNGVDYQMLNGTVTIPAGSFSAKLIVTPIPDKLVEGTETVTISLLPSPGCAFGVMTNPTVKLRDMPRDEWRRSQFSPEQLNDPNVGTAAADPDNDGIPNLAEFALGLDPFNPDVANKPGVAIENNRLTLRYQRAKAAADVSVWVEISTNLLQWFSGAAWVYDFVNADNGVFESRIAQSLAPMDSNALQFMRIQIASP